MDAKQKTEGLANRGNWAALKKTMKRAEEGQHINIGFLGGSITQGSLSSSPYTCYAYLVYEWWKNMFPKAEFSYINGGIGGTSSHFGAARAWEDVLCYRPDVVVVDFSVNDEPTEFFQETFEGTVRTILSAPSAPAVILLNNVFYETGENAQELHNRIGAHYGIPCVSIRDSVWRRLRMGEFSVRDISPDGLHPNDRGHRMAADVICGLLESVRNEMEQQEEPAAFPAPLTANAYEGSVCCRIQDKKETLYGFTADPSEKKGMLDIFKNGWTAKKTGDKIVFEITCSNLAVQYRKSVKKPVPVAEAVIDGDEAHPVILDGNFTEDWGDCLYLQPLMHHGRKGLHRLEIRIREAEQIVRPFYLVSVIVS